jgi:hypothetical protein
MPLPGMPSGRPCALAKTPARTRKHCVFLLPPQRMHVSHNAHSGCGFICCPIYVQLLDLVLFTQHWLFRSSISHRPRSSAFSRHFFNRHFSSCLCFPRPITVTSHSEVGLVPRLQLSTEIISPSFSVLQPGTESRSGDLFPLPNVCADLQPWVPIFGSPCSQQLAGDSF